jgi:hypothetical protein
MRVGRRRECPQPLAKDCIADESVDDRAQARMGDLGGEKLEEAVELFDVAPCLRDECRRIGFGGLERAHLEL